MKLTSGVQKKQRQVNALQRLENQLLKGIKPATKGRNGSFELMIPLIESDIKRINKEIEVLKQRI